jgi:NHLM bacteriocin system ABC transporter ATP-binding protein
VSTASAEQQARILAERLGASRMEALAGRILDLSDPETVWILLAGRVDVQAVPLREGRAAGTGRHLFEAVPGHLLPGTEPQPDAAGGEVALRGRCAAGTVLARTTRERLAALSLDLEALVAIERWVESLAAIALPGTRALSSEVVEADPGQVFPPGAALHAPHGSIVWIEVAAGEALVFGDAATRLRPGDAAWPLTETGWLTLPEGATLAGHLTPARMASGAVWGDIAALNRLVLRAQGEVKAREAAEMLARQARRAAWTQARFGDGLLRLGRAADEALRAAPLAPPPAADGWAEAFALVAEAGGIPLPESGPRPADLEAAALAAGVAVRPVKLLGPWWQGDHGPLLGFLAQPGAPDGRRAVALLPDGPAAYRAVTGRGAAAERVTAAFAAQLLPTALMLYRPLPEGVRNLGAMLRFAARGTGGDLRMIGLMGLLVSALGLLTPVALGLLMEHVLPHGDLGLHGALIAAMAGAALGAAGFSLVQAIAVTRLQARMDLAAEAAVWGRLLRLRPGFFRGHATGDLADRANGVSEIRREVTGPATAAALGGFFALPTGLLLFAYDPWLAVIALCFTALVLAAQGGLFLLQLPRQRRASAAAGEVEAAGFETLSAMPKLRAAAAEPRAFARWATIFAGLARARLAVARVDTWREVLGGIVPLLGTALVWAGALRGEGTGPGGAALTLGAFVAFQTAFGSFLAGLLQLLRGVETAVTVAPVWERLRPILEAEQETGAGRAQPGALQGALRVSNVTFAYGPDLPPALDGVSLSIRSGEYVALVGPSGSGKSTLLRLLLGLERPDSGAVYVDGMDLATIDLAAMRRQIGVVTQGGQLAPGSILDNILGTAPLPESAAWDAARQAGLGEDIRAMPMGMQTMVAEGSGGLSGGQRQRLLIARALVRRPRILVFDEATSALDNATQSQVKDSLDRLNVTRVVVAHRLSTVRDVHRILVMERGRIVEEGSYEELIARGGLFARLAARQLA